jgi:hypothetical protein
LSRRAAVAVAGVASLKISAGALGAALAGALARHSIALVLIAAAAVQAAALIACLAGVRSPPGRYGRLSGGHERRAAAKRGADERVHR